MILIIGGAYQGKLDYAKEAFGITDGDVHICNAEDFLCVIQLTLVGSADN